MQQLFFQYKIISFISFSVSLGTKHEYKHIRRKKSLSWVSEKNCLKDKLCLIGYNNLLPLFC